MNSTEKQFIDYLQSKGIKNFEFDKQTVIIDDGFVFQDKRYMKWTYTPDVVFEVNGKKVFIEIKGGNPRFMNNKTKTYRQFSKICNENGWLFFIVRPRGKGDFKDWYEHHTSLRSNAVNKPVTWWETLQRYII